MQPLSSKPFALIIEDDRDIIPVFRHILDLTGFVTEIVLRGDRAEERLDIVNPDLILLDLNLVGTSGTQILKKVRSDDRLKETVVIVVTGHPQMGVGLESEAELILQKPVSVEQLSNFIKRLHPVDKAILRQSPYEEITNLYNHKFFLNRLGYSIEHTHRSGSPEFGILYIDCDNFRLVQQRGKDVAKRVLVETAKLLQTAVRPYDTISHFASGQFFIQVEDLATNDILHQIAKRVHSKLASSILETFGFEMTANFGMVFCSSDYRYPNDIIRDADIAMFYAKSDPNVDLVIFDPDHHGGFRSREKYTAIMRAGTLIEGITDESTPS